MRMYREIALQEKVPVVERCDVLVVGGGSAGCTAAVQAARLGARTVLVEKNGILGGTTVVAGVNFPGLFHAWGKQVIRGIGWEAIERTVERGGASLPDFSVVPDRHWKHQVLVNPFVYASVWDDLCLESGVKLRLHEMPAAVQRVDDGYAVIVAGKTGLGAVLARRLIDATADANLTALLGYPTERSEELQPGTLIYRLSGYDIEKVDPKELERRADEAIAKGELLPTDFRNRRPPFWRELRSGGGNQMHVTGIDGTTSPGRTEAELRARATLKRIHSFLRTVPGCENIEVSYVATECGVRETRRIVGEARITVDAYRSGFVWPDAVCYSFYPIDVHVPGHIDTRPLEPGVVPTIPYRALIPKGSHHLLAAGRCIAGDREASSAYRVQATCMATGQVAGAAAAIAAAKDCSVQDVPIDELRTTLATHGAIVPRENE